jgi:formate dehydrogenase iron-sulfur subunit
MKRNTTTTATVAEPTRRAFVKGAGIGAVAVAAAAIAGAPVAQASEPAPEAADEAVGVLIDLTRCSGCNSCTLACKAANRMPAPETVPVKLDSSALTFVDDCQVACGDTVHVKRQCMQCLRPGCVSACTVGALRKTPEGPVVYDADKCIGCRYCQYACPFGVPTYEWNNPLGLIAKCQMCVQRLEHGEMPACVGACPNGALRFGKRQALLAQAHAEIASNQDKYIDHVYGEHEAGGTSMLYLSSFPFAELGFPGLGDQAVPHYAEAVMQQTPWIALSVASLATMMHLILKRRGEVAAFQPDAATHTTQPRRHDGGDA